MTFEDAHIPEFKDPPGVERAADGKDMTKMLLDGELDAAIFGTVLPTDPRLKSVIPDPRCGGQGLVQEARHRADQSHGGGQELAVANPIRARCAKCSACCKESKQAAGLPKPGTIDALPFGFEAVKPALDLMSSYALEMKIIPRRYSVEELFDDVTRGL